EYGAYQVKNFFGAPDWLGGRVIADIILLNNTVNCRTMCSSRIEITLYEDLSLLNQVEFLKLVDESWEKTNIEEYEFFIKISEQEKIIDDYAFSCRIIGYNSYNNTDILDCGNFKEGSHVEIKEIWQSYSGGEILPKGKYEIKLEGKKKASEKIDWKIKSNGIWTNEWAIWGNISLGDQAEVILNSPVNNSESTTSIQYNASVNVTNGANIINISLYDNSTGIFILNQTLSLPTTVEEEVPSTDLPSSVSTTDSQRGVKIAVNENLTLINVTRFSGSTANHCSIRSEDNSATISNGSFVGENCEVNAFLEEGLIFRIVINSEASSYTLRSNTSVVYPISSTTEIVNFTTGLNSGGTDDPTTWYSLGNITINSTFGNFTEITFNSTINQTTLWNVEACDTEGDCGFAPNNFTVIFDITAPNISVTAPTGLLDYGLVGGNESVNWSVNDSLVLDTCKFDYNGTNQTVTCADNNFTFILEENNTNLTFYANDTTGNEASNFTSWEYKVFESNQTFNAETTEGATETFTINFTKVSSLQVSIINLIYNGTTNSFAYTVSGDEVFSEGTVTIPSVTSDVNVTFLWNITLNDGTTVSTQSNNQSISTINIDDCSSFTNLIYNFTQFDEANQTTLSNNTVELQVNLFDTQKTTLLINFSQKFTNTNPVQVCLENPILTTVNYSSYVIAKYFANESSTNISYSVEYHNILNETIGNTTVPKNISLYSLNNEDSTQFRLTFRDASYVLASNILVQVHRQYVEDNDFKIVEIPLTDNNGQTILNLVRNNIVYNFIMVNEAGKVVGTFNSVTAFCQDFTIGDCTINLAPDSISEASYNYNKEFDISISDVSYDNSTEEISISFITGNLEPQTVVMDVVRNNDFGNRSVCSDTLTASSGILSCDVSAITDTDQFLFVSVYVAGDLAEQNTINLNASTLTFGILNGGFLAFLLLLTLITLFGEDRQVLVVSLGLGWIIILSLGLINGKLIGFSAGGIWLLITIIIFIWKLNNEEGS
ncbi:hypothetical protein LCGC14_1475940, partial [marine sediment metagenome]